MSATAAGLGDTRLSTQGGHTAPTAATVENGIRQVQFKCKSAFLHDNASGASEALTTVADRWRDRDVHLQRWPGLEYTCGPLPMATTLRLGGVRVLAPTCTNCAANLGEYASMFNMATAYIHTYIHFATRDACLTHCKASHLIDLLRI